MAANHIDVRGDASNFRNWMRQQFNFHCCNGQAAVPIGMVLVALMALVALVVALISKPALVVQLPPTLEYMAWSHIYYYYQDYGALHTEASESQKAKEVVENQIAEEARLARITAEEEAAAAAAVQKVRTKKEEEKKAASVAEAARIKAKEEEEEEAAATAAAQKVFFLLLFGFSSLFWLLLC